MKALNLFTKREYRLIIGIDGEPTGNIARRVLSAGPEWVVVRMRSSDGSDDNLPAITEKEVDESFDESYGSALTSIDDWVFENTQVSRHEG
jgi:hypothetical protein